MIAAARRLLAHAPAGQAARYLAVGLTLLGVEYALYLAGLALAPAAPVACHLAARIAAGALGYLLHARFTFAAADAHAARVPRYAAVVLANAAVSGVLLDLALPLAGPIAGKVAADILSAGASFVAMRLLVFAPARVRPA